MLTNILISSELSLVTLTLALHVDQMKKTKALILL